MTEPSLTLMQKRILRAILRKPHGAYRDDIIMAMYYDRDEPDCAETIFSVQLCRMRYPLRRANIHIVTHVAYKTRAGSRFAVPEAELDTAFRYLEAAAAMPWLWNGQRFVPRRTYKWAPQHVQ